MTGATVTGLEHETGIPSVTLLSDELSDQHHLGN
jgi:hypothetical protein